MKAVVQISRILVGVLFIFSGLVKAIDPLGLSYKMEEFFEVWAGQGYFPALMNFFLHQAFLLSVLMITLEVVLGVALLVGWRIKLTLRWLFLLMVLFTFLTSYVLFSGKIRSCGCFGDCIPLTPIQTFSKDILLLGLIILMLLKQKYIQPLFKELLPLAFVMISLVATSYLQMHVINHLPLVDCLPFKKGNNLVELRKMPADAVPDVFAYSFIYEKGGKKQAFTAEQLPDSTWNFVDREQKLIKAGKNNVPKINDFSLTDSTGADSTEIVLNKSKYYLFFIKDLDGGDEKWLNSFSDLHKQAQKEDKPIFVVTANPKKAQQYFNLIHDFKVQVYTCDGTAIKTAARANPTLYDMKGPIVQGKYSWADIEQVSKPEKK